MIAYNLELKSPPAPAVTVESVISGEFKITAAAAAAAATPDHLLSTSGESGYFEGNSGGPFSDLHAFLEDESNIVRDQQVGTSCSPYLAKMFKTPLPYQVVSSSTPAGNGDAFVLTPPTSSDDDEQRIEWTYLEPARTISPTEAAVPPHHPEDMVTLTSAAAVPTTSTRPVNLSNLTPITIATSIEPHLQQQQQQPHVVITTTPSTASSDGDCW